MPIHDRIPREIFETILHLCVGSDTPVRDLETLQLVCRTWRDIIAEASFLWGTLTTFEGRQAFNKALRMAKNSSLDIFFFDEYLDFWPIPIKKGRDVWTSLDFFTEAGEKIDQWRSLEIQTINMEGALTFIQTLNPPPKLVMLSIESDNEYDVPEGPGAAVFGGAPVTGLKHVKLSRAPINIPSLGLTGLKSLNLEKIPSTTAADILTILNNSPTLTTLRLVEFGGALLLDQLATDEPNPSPIHLPFLIDLALVDLPFPFLDLLLSNLVVPQLRSLHVFDQPPVIIQVLALKTGNLNTALTSVSSGARNYEIMLYLDGCMITIGGLIIGLICEEIRRPMDKLDETFGALSDHLRGLDLADLPLHLRCDFYAPILSDLEWFTRKTNVTALTFSCGTWVHEGRMDTVIRLLGQPTSEPSPIWLLPQLEVFQIDIATTELWRVVVDMIKTRHAAVLGLFPGAPGTVPKLYKEIGLYNQGDCPLPSPLDEIMTEVVQATKGAVVHWEPPEAYVINPLQW